MNSKYILGVLCKRGHDYQTTGMSLRYKSGSCVLCQKEAHKNLSPEQLLAKNVNSARWHKDNPLTKGQRKLYYEKYREKRIAYCKVYRLHNRGANAARMRHYRKTHKEIMQKIENRRVRPESHREFVRQYTRMYKKLHADSVRAAYQRRRAAISINNTPKTAEEFSFA